MSWTEVNQWEHENLVWWLAPRECWERIFERMNEQSAHRRTVAS